MWSQFLQPFAPLSSQEILSTSAVIRKQWPGRQLDFKTITLKEPEKVLMIPYLEAVQKSHHLPTIPRQSLVSYYSSGTSRHYEAIVDLTEARIVSNVLLADGIHSMNDMGEFGKTIEIVLRSDKVQEQIEKLQLPKGTVILPEPWIYGSDGNNDDKRMFQVYLFARDPHNSSEEDSNHYAFPLPISVVVDLLSMEVVRVEWLPTGEDTSTSPKPYKIHAPNEYLPEYQELRPDLKPLNVVQPEGASFKVQQGALGGETIQWQKWAFQIGFNSREGMVLYNVSYAGRSLFYRLSLSDMNIPYSDPRQPFHKKAAFDLGDVGAGTTANNLKLGCDCLGSIHYVSAVLANHEGNVQDMPNVMCIHEQDNGIGWKHTNFRTGRAAIVRNRELVVQTIMTAANYEYILAFIFNQAGEICYEVRATGILSTQSIDDGISVPWGTIVHPGVLATHHQHIFSLRIDPAIDGHRNQLTFTDVEPLPRSEFNPHGTGYITKDTTVERSSALNGDVSKNRFFCIENSSVRNPINGKAVGYKIQAPPFQHLVADKESWHYKRAEFGSHDLYVSKHHDSDLYAGGLYTNQSRGGTGVRSFVERNESVQDEDIVVWVSFGMNHIPRIEDFPVMPVEIIKVSLKPHNFFDKSPSMDVPPSTQASNCSTEISLADLSVKDDCSNCIEPEL